MSGAQFENDVTAKRAEDSNHPIFIVGPTFYLISD
jgi:hypothetical protein